MTQETRFVGLDIGKFEIYAVDASRNAEMVVANTALGHLALADWLGEPDDIVIALESTGGYPHREVHFGEDKNISDSSC